MVLMSGKLMGQLVEERGRSDEKLMRSRLVQYPKVLAALAGLCPGSAALGAAWHALGTIYCYALVNDTEAKAAFEQALRLQKAALGPRHAAVAKTMRRLGLVLSVAGNSTAVLDEAEGLIQSARAISVEVYGPEHLEVAETLSSLAHNYWARGDYARHKELLEETLRLKESLLNASYAGGPRDSTPAPPKERENSQEQLKLSIAVTLTSLGNAFSDLQDPTTAKAYLERALDIKQDHYGLSADNITIASSLMSLGLALIKCNDLVRARECLERALPIFVRLEHPNVKEVQAGLAEIAVKSS